ncbi:MAG: cupredoxin domain-containing protein [Patescibacteria group bacterium]|nr:cupredoxin domain-containing protein [Patescibacteria group bacterium]
MYQRLTSVPVWVYGLAVLSFAAALIVAPNARFVNEARAAQSGVSMVGMTFSPGTITIAAGDTVTWTNNSSLQHTVTADDGSFDSGTINAGGTYSHTFMTPGTYRYYCRFHGALGGVGMSGTIVVTRSNANTQPNQSNTQQTMPVVQMLSTNTTSYSPQTSYQQPYSYQPTNYQQPTTQSYTNYGTGVTGYAYPTQYQSYQPSYQYQAPAMMQHYFPCHTSMNYRQPMPSGYSYSMMRPPNGGYTMDY